MVRSKAVSSKTLVLLLRLRHQLHQDRWQQGGYEPLPDLLVEECISVQVNGDQLEPLEAMTLWPCCRPSPAATSMPANGPNCCNGPWLIWIASSRVAIPGGTARPTGGRRPPPRA